MNTDFKIPESLKKALKEGEVVPFIGAGVSMSVKKSPLEASLDDSGNEKKDSLGNIIHKSIFPSWWEFLFSAADKLDKECIDLNNKGESKKGNHIRKLLNKTPVEYLHIAQYAFDALGERLWYDLLKENFEKDIDSADERSKKLSKLIWQLANNLIVTTNVDLVLKSVHEKPHLVKPLDTQESEFGKLQKGWNPSRPTVLQLHGHIDNEANVIFTENQYKSFYDLKNNKAKLDALHNLFTQQTILFIGFSLDDLAILKELEKVNVIYKGAASYFYVLVRKSDRNNPNIPKYVQKIVFSEFGKPLEDLIEELIKIAGNGKTKIDEPVVKKSFFNLPFASKGTEFVGRVGKIEEIWNQLNKDGCASIGQAVNVKGFGGLGKTQLAVEYAHAKRDEYKNGVFWLVADQPIDVQLLTIGDAQGWTANVSETVNQLDAAKAGFRQLSDCLILFDNVESYDEIKDYLPKADERTHILITSRERIPQFHQFDLELLEREESRKLLLKISKRSPNDKTELEYLEKILETLGDIPLAVELVGGYLAEHELVTFEKYHKYLDEVPLDKLEKEFPKGSFTDHDRSIIQTLRISEKIINEKPLMVEILKILAWSGNSSMGISLLKELVEAETDFAFENALNDAHKLRLLKKDEGGERFAIHRLLAKVIQYENPLEEQNEWHKKMVNNLENWFNTRENKFETLAEFESEIEHLESWQEQTFRIIPSKSVILLQLRGNVPGQRGLYQKTLNFCKEALDLYEKENLTDKSLLADLQNDLGVYYGHLGIHEEALKYQLQSLKIRRQIFGENHSDTAQSLNNVGMTYGYLGNYEESLKYLLQSLKICRQVFSENHSYTAFSLNNIGSTYAELGNHKEALKYQLQSLEMRRQIFGENHPAIAFLLNNVGYTYGDLGKHKEALKYQLQSLSIHQTLLGKQHPNTIVIVGNLINIYLKLGETEKAGRKAAEFFEFVPQNHRYWQFFEEISRPYR